MMRTIHLHGAAKNSFGGPFKFDVQSPAHAARALFQLAGFEHFLRRHDWRIIRCKGPLHVAIGEEELCLQFGDTADLHLVPLAAGRAGRGKSIGKILAGAAIAVAAIILAIPSGGGSLVFGTAVLGGLFTAGGLLTFGVGVALAGVSGLLTKAPVVKGYSNREGATADNKPSFLFNGPVNVVSQGATLPVVAGLKIRTGSVVASASISTETFKPA